MKKFLITIMVIGLLCSLCACAKQQSGGQLGNVQPIETTEAAPTITGVPESVVLRDIEIEEGATYELVHHYDAPSHIDDVTLTVISEKEYGVRETTYSYAYQYDKSADLWTRMKEDCEQSSKTLLNEDAFLDKRFEGDFKEAHSGFYMLHVRDVDFSAGTATVHYTIIFDDGSPSIINVETFNLRTSDDGSVFYFAIPYTRSMVVRFQLLCILDIEKGLYI